MSELHTVWKPLAVLAVLAVLLLAGCGGGAGDAERSGGGASSSASQPSGKGACGLLLQGEVDELFGAAVGAGLDEDLGEGVTFCTWPASGEPRLLLQVGPASDDVRAAVDLGQGYRISELTGMGWPAAVAVLEPEGDAPPIVAVVALNFGEKTLVVSPIGLDVAEASPGFERFKAIVDAAGGRF